MDHSTYELTCLTLPYHTGQNWPLCLMPQDFTCQRRSSGVKGLSEPIYKSLFFNPFSTTRRFYARRFYLSEKRLWCGRVKYCIMVEYYYHNAISSTHIFPHIQHLILHGLKKRTVHGSRAIFIYSCSTSLISLIPFESKKSFFCLHGMWTGIRESPPITVLVPNLLLGPCQRLSISQDNIIWIGSLSELLMETCAVLHLFWFSDVINTVSIC